MHRPIKIALAKGRIATEALPLLAKAGFLAEASLRDSRKLIFESEHRGVQLIVIRSADVPVYVERGAAEIGIVGKDVLMEYEGDGIYEYLDLGIARCKLMVAGVRGVSLPERGRIRVATKYVNSARGHFLARNRQIEVIKLYGSIELAPLVGLSDLIVDLVDTGKTLQANGLVAYEKVARISARLIVNKASIKIENETLQRVLGSFSHFAVAGGGSARAPQSTMKYQTDDIRITDTFEVAAPADISAELPLSEAASECVYRGREAIRNILHGRDSRLLVVVGPCSIHNVEAALEYGEKLRASAVDLKDYLHVVMRVYFEKPRTTVGWEGADQRP